MRVRLRDGWVCTSRPLLPQLAGTVETLGGGQYHLFITEHLGSCSGLLPRVPSCLFPSSQPVSLPRPPPLCTSQFCPDLPLPPQGPAHHSHPEAWWVSRVNVTPTFQLRTLPLRHCKRLTQGHTGVKWQSQAWTSDKFME